MRILFDHGTPAPLRRALADHEIITAYEKGWATLINGDLLTAAEREFGAFITTDQNLRDQQSFANRRLAILVCRQPVGRRFSVTLTGLSLR